MNKIIGYILIIAGIIGVAVSYSQVSGAIGITIPAGTDLYVMAVGVIILLIGVFLAFKGSSNKLKEVPIYKGKHIVGYRQLK